MYAAAATRAIDFSQLANLWGTSSRVPLHCLILRDLHVTMVVFRAILTAVNWNFRQLMHKDMLNFKLRHTAWVGSARHCCFSTRNITYDPPPILLMWPANVKLFPFLLTIWLQGISSGKINLLFEQIENLTIDMVLNTLATGARQSAFKLQASCGSALYKPEYTVSQFTPETRCQVLPGTWQSFVVYERNVFSHNSSLRL